MYAQYGCGDIAPEGWLNFDASPTLRFERLPVLGRFYSRNEHRFPVNVRYGDIVKGLPIPLGSCAAIYCSHVLEHLALEDFDAALSNTFGHLKYGGTFRLVVPDIAALVERYRADGDAMAFIEATGMGQVHRPRGVRGLVAWLGNSAHRWMWDEKAMANKLRAHGFADIRRAQSGEAEDGRFSEVERLDRFIDALAMQCRRH